MLLWMLIQSRSSSNCKHLQTLRVTSGWQQVTPSLTSLFATLVLRPSSSTSGFISLSFSSRIPSETSLADSPQTPRKISQLPLNQQPSMFSRVLTNLSFQSSCSSVSTTVSSYSSNKSPQDVLNVDQTKNREGLIRCLYKSFP